MPVPQPQKTAEMVMLENIQAGIDRIEEEMKEQRRLTTRLDRENIVIRSNHRSLAREVGIQGKLVTKHERNHNLVLGGSAVIGVVMGFLGHHAGKLWEKLNA